MKRCNQPRLAGLLSIVCLLWISNAQSELDIAILEEIEAERTMECVKTAVPPDKAWSAMQGGPVRNFSWEGLEDWLKGGEKDTTQFEERYGLSPDDPLLVATRDISAAKRDLIRLDFKYNRIEEEKCGRLCFSKNGKEWDHNLGYVENLKAQACEFNPDYELKTYTNPVTGITDRIYRCKYEEGIENQKRSESIYKQSKARIEKARETITSVIKERSRNQAVIDQEQRELLVGQFNTWFRQCNGKWLLRQPAEQACENAEVSNPICKQRNEQGQLPELVSLSDQRIQFGILETAEKIWETVQPASWVPFQTYQRDGDLIRPPGSRVSTRKGNVSIIAGLSFYVAARDEIDAPLYDHIRTIAASSELPYEKHGFVAWPMIEVGGDFPSPFTTEDAYSLSLGLRSGILQQQPQPGESFRQRELLVPEVLERLQAGEALHVHGWETLLGEPVEAWKIALGTEGQADVIRALLEYQKGDLFEHIRLVKGGRQ